MQIPDEFVAGMPGWTDCMCRSAGRSITRLAALPEDCRECLSVEIICIVPQWGKVIMFELEDIYLSLKQTVPRFQTFAILLKEV
jgi:hypothetical protein